MYTLPLTEGNYFHLFSRGINGENIFKEIRNYHYFLQQYQYYCADVLETFAYALLKNHFHLFVYTKENVMTERRDGKGMMQLNASKQLSHFLNAYTQSFNKACKRTGPLFESPFKRRMITDDAHFTEMISYCHYNPQLHGFVQCFKEWKFTSYDAIINGDDGICSVNQVINRFGSRAMFEKAHEGRFTGRRIKEYWAE